MINRGITGPIRYGHTTADNVRPTVQSSGGLHGIRITVRRDNVYKR
jgi:hypothetical protein